MSKYLEITYVWGGGDFHPELNYVDRFTCLNIDNELETLEVDKNENIKFYIDLDESVAYNNSVIDTISKYNKNWVLESIKFSE